MLITPSTPRWQQAKEDREHEDIMRKDREAFEAFQRAGRDYQRLRRRYAISFWLMVMLMAVFAVLRLK